MKEEIDEIEEIGKEFPMGRLVIYRKEIKNFTALDFETANECRSSVCGVGVVIVRDGFFSNFVNRYGQ